MRPHESEIKRRVTLADEHAMIFEYRCDEGRLKAHYRSATGTFWIDKLHVSQENRRKNIGNQLLQAAKLSAESIEADNVMARITSKECLSAMSRVFGAQNISIRREGEFAPVGEDTHPELPTSAHLDYTMVSQPQE